jgi:hypothetical protein
MSRRPVARHRIDRFQSGHDGFSRIRRDGSLGDCSSKRPKIGEELAVLGNAALEGDRALDVTKLSINSQVR